jgi:hypothetical protein
VYALDVFEDSQEVAGTDHLKVTHPDRLRVTYLGPQDGHPGQGW